MNELYAEKCNVPRMEIDLGDGVKAEVFNEIVKILSDVKLTKTQIKQLAKQLDII